MIIAPMYGRKDGPKAALKFFLFTFIPSAPLLVAILWLYAKTGTFDFAQLQMYVASGALPVAPLFWVALAFLFAFTSALVGCGSSGASPAGGGSGTTPGTYVVTVTATAAGAATATLPVTITVQ